jgi:DNA-binding transcriptional LysR family regulator
MRLQHLHLILKLAQTGSLRASAQALNVTQPALSKALKQLEEEFGTALVLRTPKGVRLAPAGELLAARAATVVREIERAREEVTWHTQHAQATVTVGVSPAAALMLVPRAVTQFQIRWPQVRVRLVDALYPKVLQQLRSGELDLALGPLPSSGLGSDLDVQKLIDSPEVIAARESHPLAKCKHLVGLESASWVLTGPAHGPGDPEHLSLEALGLPPPRVKLECESFSTLLAVLPGMDALALMPKRFFDSHGPRTGLTALPITDALPKTTIHIFWRTDGPLTLPTQCLKENFEQEAKTLCRERKV